MSLLSLQGHIRVFSIEEDESRSKWSDAFSIDVIKSKGATTCRVANDRTYMVRENDDAREIGSLTEPL